MAAPTLPADVKALREQLLRDQAPSARKRTNYFDPSAFSGRHGRPYSSRRIPIDTLMEMRTDAILRFAQLTALVSIFTAKWHIECSNARKASFIDHALRRIIGRLIVQYFESWNFGWQAIVKEFGLMNPGWTYLDKDAEGGARSMPVWDGGPEVPALVWEPFVTLRPSTVAPVWTEGGAFNGIAVDHTGALGAYAFPTVPLMPGDIVDLPHDINARFTDEEQNRVKVDVQHALWVTNERDSQFGSIWGYPRLGYAYKYWWAYEMTLGILNRSMERKGDPTVVVSYPPGASRLDGQEVSNQTIAMQIGDSARSGSVLAVPSDVWGDDMGSSNQAPKWKIDYLRAEEKFDELTKVLGYLDTLKFRSMLVSELALAEGSGGTSSRNVAAVTGERTAEAQIFTMTEWDEIINRYLIPQLADANFPELKDEPARKVTQAFGQDEAVLAADLIRSMANSNANGLPIDWKRELDRFQISSLEGEELARWEQNLVAQAEQSTPPEVEAKPGENAGVTDTGFYYDARERIDLSEDETLLAALPKTKHYKDATVLSQTRLVRKLWRQTLAEQYEDFASHLEHLDEVELADRFMEKAAERIVGTWRSSSASVVKSVSVALSKILARAGVVELGASRLETDSWDPNSENLAEWARENAGALVRSVDETTRSQMMAFLASELGEGRTAKQMADNLRKHFSGFPDWRADLIAREETKRYYNAGTLFAAKSAGASQVQALDARTPGPTDEACEKRNGRVFSVEDAWQESAKEHVRGTLAWRIIPAGVQLSFTRHTQEEMAGVAARIDQQERVIHLVEGLDPATEGRFLERAVEWLIMAA